jgi:hypothetical protein
MGAGLPLQAMEHTRIANDNPDRVIHVPLSEVEWKAFLAATPQPVSWLRERIQEAIQQKARDSKSDA